MNGPGGQIQAGGGIDQLGQMHQLARGNAHIRVQPDLVKPIHNITEHGPLGTAGGTDFFL